MGGKAQAARLPVWGGSQGGHDAEGGEIGQRLFCGKTPGRSRLPARKQACEGFGLEDGHGEEEGGEERGHKGEDTGGGTGLRVQGCQVPFALLCANKEDGSE